VPVPAHTCDFLVASSYKWLLGPHGLGVLYWNRQRRPEADPVGVGWYGLRETFASDRFQSYQLKPDAARFQTGMPNFAAIYALDASVRLLLDVGIERIEAHVLSLGAQLIEQLGGLGQDVMTPREAPRKAGNIAFVDPNGGQTAALLARDGVHVWGGDGRVRASIHLFNDATDIARLVAGVESVRRIEAACD
jgi:cysteine desulfurase / selenocysteine lyase